MNPTSSRRNQAKNNQKQYRAAKCGPAAVSGLILRSGGLPDPRVHFIDKPHEPVVTWPPGLGSGVDSVINLKSVSD